MAQQRRTDSWRTGVAACLAITAVLVFAGVPATLANSGRDSGQDSTAGAYSASRPAARAAQQLAKGRTTVSALSRKRDPFKLPPPPGLGEGDAGPDGPLPPGSRGLVIGRMELKGIVREDASNAMIAVVTNPSNLAYFLRIHDKVYNGVVTRITANSIHFAEDRLDAGGQIETREVVLKLGSRGQETR